MTSAGPRSIIGAMALPDPDESYTTRAAVLLRSAEALRARARLLSNARLATFLLFLVAGIFAELGTTILWGVAAGGAIAFVLLVVHHRRSRAQIREFEARAALCDLGLARRARDWNRLPVVVPVNPNPHPYIHDLDLFGERAVTQLLGPVRTHHGLQVLRGWLMRASPVDDVRERQNAVRVLRDKMELRETIAYEGGLLDAHSRPRLEAFLKWVETPMQLPMPMEFLTIVRWLPLITFGLIGAQLAGMVNGTWWILPFVASAILVQLTLRRTHAILDAAFGTDPSSLQYSKLFAIAAHAPHDGVLLERIRARLHAGGTTASVRIKKLEQVMVISDARHGPGFATIFLEGFLLWSLQALIALEKWQEDSGHLAKDWFNALGELEAISSLATLAHDQPSWCLPNLDSNNDRIEAVQIGHPMLADSVRVHNDVTVGPRGTLLLVTGSNMSGKSTLLRSVGVNTVLAQAGGPVCAVSYRAPILHLYTSINVHDSITAGISLYMAQLQRLKEVLDAAKNATPDEPCCYLLDEILSGTNSADRTVAVRAVLHQLLNSNAIGVVTTHDLAVAADERIQSTAQKIHFTETIDPERGTMTFDYHARTGQAKTSNALELMRMMGIEID